MASEIGTQNGDAAREGGGIGAGRNKEKEKCFRAEQISLTEVTSTGLWLLQ